MIRLTPMAPILLKNMANPFGKIMRHIVESTAVIVASVCQASVLKRISLKLKAVRIPDTPVIKNNIRHNIETAEGLIDFNNHVCAVAVFFIITPKPDATPWKWPIP